MKNAICCIVVTLALAAAQSWADDTEDFVILPKAQIQWQPSPFPGVDSALLAGHPDKPGLYIMRARFQPGRMTPPHFHSQTRYATVISGVWHVGTDASYSPERTVALRPGDFMKHPIGAVHYDGAIDVEAIVEIRGIGPVTTELVTIVPATTNPNGTTK